MLSAAEFPCIPSANNEFEATLPEEVPLCTDVVPLDSKISQGFYRDTDESSAFRIF